MLLNLRLYETVTRNIAQINWTAGSVFLTLASLAPIHQLLALSSRVLHHREIKWCLFRLGIWFWEGRHGQDGRRDHTSTPSQRHIHLLVLNGVSFVNGEETEEGFCGLRVGLCLQLGLCGQTRLEPQRGSPQAARPLCLLEAGVGQDTVQWPGGEEPPKESCGAFSGSELQILLPCYLYPGFPMAIHIVFSFGNREADWKLRLYL